MSYDDTVGYGDIFDIGKVIIFRGEPTHVNNENITVKLAITWTCAYCGQSNAAERESCWGCQAPRTEAI